MQKIILSGGGTLGSVTPLLAIKDELSQIIDKADFLWVGTKTGVEKDFVRKHRINYKPICSGKIRRYFSLKNFIDPFLIIQGFFQSFCILMKFRPQIIITAGSFVSVPLAYAAYLLRIPVYMHHMDLQVGLANKLIAKVAFRINITFKENEKDFPKNKVVWLGNPIRRELQFFDKAIGLKKLNLDSGVKTLLVLGGGTGAQYLNDLIGKCIDSLNEFCQVIHITGKGKYVSKDSELKKEKKHKYVVYEFMDEELKYAYCAADLVVSRAGMATITELLLLKKPMLLVPITDHQQVYNAKFLHERKAAMVYSESDFAKSTAQKVKSVLFATETNVSILTNASAMLPLDSAVKIANDVMDILKSDKKTAK